jgi:hypothetical protein
MSRSTMNEAATPPYAVRPATCGRRQTTFVEHGDHRPPTSQVQVPSSTTNDQPMPRELWSSYSSKRSLRGDG